MKRHLIPFLLAAALDGHFVPERPTLASAEGDPPAPGGPTPPAPPAAPAAPTPPAPPTEGDVLTLTSTQFSERLTRGVRSTLKKELGVESVEDVKASLDRLKKYEQEEETRRQAQLSAEQRLNEQLAQEKAAREAAERQAEQLRFDAHIRDLCIQNGIKNVDYATFKLAGAIAGSEKDFDEASFVKGLLDDPRERAALGIDLPSRTEVTTPTTTANGKPAPAAPPANAPAQTMDAFGMDNAAWLARKAQLGIL